MRVPNNSVFKLKKVLIKVAPEILLHIELRITDSQNNCSCHNKRSCFGVIWNVRYNFQISLYQLTSFAGCQKQCKVLVQNFYKSNIFDYLRNFLLSSYDSL